MREAVLAFAAALVWTVQGALSGDVGWAPGALLALFGCISTVFVPVALIWRRGRPDDPESRAMLHGATLAAAPLAGFGALLFAKTHHRALGGVTYAFVSAGVVIAGVLLGRRISHIGRWGKAPGVVLAAAANLCVLFMTLALAALAATHPDGDGLVVGVVLLSLAMVAPLERLPAWTRYTAMAGVLAAATGVVLFALNQDLRRHLAETAPVATFVMQMFLP